MIATNDRLTVAIMKGSCDREGSMIATGGLERSR
jgi:hypothetical protein